MVSPQPNTSIIPKRLQVVPQAQIQLQMLPLQRQAQVPRQPSAQSQKQQQPPPLEHPLTESVEEKSESGGTSVKTDVSSSPHSLTTVESDAMHVSEQEVSNVGEGESVVMEEEVVRESDLQVQEEIISALQSEQKHLDQDPGPYFQPPRPPRRVSLLEYKERKEKRRFPSEEMLSGESEVSTTLQVKEPKVIQPPTEAGDKTSESTECQPNLDDQSMKSPSHKHEITLRSEFPQSVSETKPTESGRGYGPAQDSGKQSSPVCASKDLDPCLSTSLTTEQIHVPSSIEWPTVKSSETKKNVPLSATATPVTEVPIEKTEGVTEGPQSEAVLTQQSEPQLHKIEEKKKSQKEKEEEKREKKSSEKEALRKEKDQEREKQVEKESVPERRGKRDSRGIDWEEKLEELEKEWRKKREKEMEEKEKGIARKPVKPLGSRKASTSPHVAPHSSSPQFPSGHSRFPIPLHRGPGFHPPHPLQIPPPSIPHPRPPPPQPFLGFPSHPFHQPPPAPFTPPQPPDIWSMFGSLFAQHNLFPTEEPPPPPPRPPSPPLPPVHYSSPRGLSPCHSSPRRMSPRQSPSPRRDSLPHCSPSPCSSPTPMCVSPSGPAAFFSRARARSRSRSSSPVPKSQPLEPKPRQLDAKQFRIISELIKRTTVKKCDIAVQAVSPRKVSQGVQDGRGFRLRSTAVQVKARTWDVSTHTDFKTEVQHRSE